MKKKRTEIPISKKDDAALDRAWDKVRKQDERKKKPPAKKK